MSNRSSKSEPAWKAEGLRLVDARVADHRDETVVSFHGAPASYIRAHVEALQENLKKYTDDELPPSELQHEASRLACLRWLSIANTYRPMNAEVLKVDPVPVMAVARGIAAERLPPGKRKADALASAANQALGGVVTGELSQAAMDAARMASAKNFSGDVLCAPSPETGYRAMVLKLFKERHEDVKEFGVKKGREPDEDAIKAAIAKAKRRVPVYPLRRLMSWAILGTACEYLGESFPVYISEFRKVDVIYRLMSAGVYGIIAAEEQFVLVGMPAVSYSIPTAPVDPNTDHLSRGMWVRHCDDGPARAWADPNRPGEYEEESLQWFIEGVGVDRQTVMDPKSLDPLKIIAEENAEVRRIKMERYGAGEVLIAAGAEVIDMDQTVGVGGSMRALYSLNDGSRYLAGTDGGTGRTFVMAVEDDVNTCREAHVSICGFDESRIKYHC